MVDSTLKTDITVTRNKNDAFPALFQGAALVFIIWMFFGSGFISAVNLSSIPWFVWLGGLAIWVMWVIS